MVGYSYKFSIPDAPSNVLIQQPIFSSPVQNI